MRYYEGRELVSKLMSVFVGLSILLLRQERELNSKPVVFTQCHFCLSPLGLGLFRSWYIFNEIARCDHDGACLKSLLLLFDPVESLV